MLDQLAPPHRLPSRNESVDRSLDVSSIRNPLLGGAPALGPSASDPHSAGAADRVVGPCGAVNRRQHPFGILAVMSDVLTLRVPILEVASWPFILNARGLMNMLDSSDKQFDQQLFQKRFHRQF